MKFVRPHLIHAFWLLLAACGSAANQRPSAGGPGNPAATPADAAPVPPGAFVATVESATLEEGRQSVGAVVRRNYFAAEAPPSEVAAALQAHTHVDDVTAGGGSVRVRAWVDNAALRDVADRALAEQPALTRPALPLRTLQDVARTVAVMEAGRLREAWCTLRVRAEGAACDADDSVAGMREALTEAARSVQLRQMPPDGAPHKPGQAPYRPLVVVASYGAADALQPWVGLPLKVQAPADRLAALNGTTDGRGQWQAAWQGAPQAGETFAVQVDAESLLGPTYASLWTSPPLAVRFRPLTNKSLRLVLTFKSSTHPRDPLVDGARALVLETLARLLPGVTLASSGSLANKARLEDNAAAGHDVMANADVTWAFASALGGRSVWYEARAHLETLNVWTGETLFVADPSVQEAGIGDKHAAKQAVNKLAVELARHIAEALKTSFPVL